MPPAAVRSIRDIIFWQYAKIIAESSKVGKNNYTFIMSKYMELKMNEIHWSNSIREYVKEHENAGKCIYCGISGKLTLDHILPISRGGPDIIENTVMVCKSCNSSKGAKRLYEWKGINNKDKHHRIAEGKYLKLLFKLHEERGTLCETEIKKLCTLCDMKSLCQEANTIEKLTVYCLEGCFNKL